MSKIAQYAKSPSQFREDLTVDAGGMPTRFGDVQDAWQRSDFEALDPALLRVAGVRRKAERMRAWWERPRGHDKTSGIAKLATWLLAFSRKPLRGYCYAADKDQAGLLRDAVETLVRLNPYLARVLEVRASSVVNIASRHPAEGSVLSIEACDVASSYGILPDFIIADELTHWSENRGENLWHSILSSAAKRENCLLLVIANAGFELSWQWKVREAVRSDPGWTFSRLEEPRATWITADRLAEQRRLLPGTAFERLWLNRWSSAGGDALTPEDIDAAFNGMHGRMTGSEPDYTFAAGVDLGLTRDCSAVVVLGVHRPSAMLRLATARLWRPKPGLKVNIEEVEREIIALDAQFNLKAVAVDPWQAEHLGQRLEHLTEHRRRSQRHLMGAKPWIRMVPPTAANLREQATFVIETFTDRRLQCFNYPPLLQDLRKLRAVEKSYGIRLESPRDSEGHGDTFSAFALALTVAHEESTRRPARAGAILEDPNKPMGWREIADELDRKAGRIAGCIGWNVDSCQRDGFMKALNDLHRTDPFFQQFRRR